MNAADFTKIYSCSVFESCGPLRFHKDGKRVYMETNKGDADLTSLVLLDPETQKIEKVESDPLNKADFGEELFSEATDDLVLTTYTDQRTAPLLQGQEAGSRLSLAGEEAARPRGGSWLAH